MLAKRIALVVVAFLLMAAAWDDCAEIPGESQFDDVTLTGFTDVTKDHRLYNGIRVAEIEGWFAGYPDGTLRPEERITAEQIAKVVNRLYPDGATRAEVANFLAAGSIGVLQKNITMVVSQVDQTVTLSNLGSYPVDLDGYKLLWTADSGLREFLIEGLSLGAGEDTTISLDEPLPPSVTLNNRYALQISEAEPEPEPEPEPLDSLPG